ncbi:MAG TPA: FtsK/SpoIIIE domain-containing protein [Phycisphaerales bacterium]|nr:FtsK/SpoIIIE domain-containing protein [Phycisphaerales bacterium]
MHNDLLTSGQRNMVRDLLALVADRAEREARLPAAFAAADAAAADELARTCRKLDERLKAQLREAETLAQETVRRVTEHFQAVDGATRRTYTDDRNAIEDMAAENEKKAAAKLEESLWLTDTVYEAHRDQPREQFDQRCKVLELLREEASETLDKTRTLLQQSRVRVNFDQSPAHADSQPTSDDPDVAIESAMARLREHAEAIASMRLPALFKGVRPFALGALIVALAAGGGWMVDGPRTAGIAAGAAVVGAAILLGILNLIARSSTKRHWASVQLAHRDALAVHEQCIAKAERDRDARISELAQTRDNEIAAARKRYEPVIEEIRRRLTAKLEVVDEKYPRLLREAAERREADLAEAQRHYDETTTRARQEHAQQWSEARDRIAARRAELRETYEREWRELETQWNEGVARAASLREAIARDDHRMFPAWTDERWNGWTPPSTFPPAVRFGSFRVDLASLEGGLPNDPRLALPESFPTAFDLPATLSFPGSEGHSSLLIEAAEHSEEAVSLLQVVMLRLLTCLPPGKVRFTILDPVGLGQNFAGFMHLADYNDAFVGGKIWTEPRHIDQRLTDLTEHMENVIQKYLRNEFETINQYNEQAGEIAEPYRFLVIADFPVNFSETAAKRLASIVNSGARCGVHTLIVADSRQKMPPGIDLADVRRNSVCLRWETPKRQSSETSKDNESGGASRPSPRFVLADADYERFSFTPDPPPSEEFTTRVLHIVGREALDSTRVEVPFDVIAPADKDLWSLSTETDLRIALGRTGATKLQYMTLGRGTAQHALVAGKTGSGKSTLLHALITNLALWYSPDEVEMYLVDFKKGVEFKTYASHRLPHVRAVAVESDREFGISVLQRLDQELQRRGERYRQVGVQDLAGFRKASPGERMPRTLLIIDEFQELFTEDDKIAQDASLLLDRIVRQGRAFGMHVLLGSQTLGGAYSLARSTLGQMGVRIALQCSEADSYLILSDDNAAARLLSRPGEAIYNDASGTLEGNSPFQVVWLPDERREVQLKRVESLAERALSDQSRALPPPIVFEGNIPADASRNHLLADFIESPRLGEPPTAWLGEAIAIKDPTAVPFRRLSGGNLLIVGQRDDAALAMLAVSLISLSLQHVPSRSNGAAGGAQFWFFDGSPAEAHQGEYLTALAESVPQDVRLIRPREAPDAVAEIAAELERRQDADLTDPREAPPIYMFLYGAQRFRNLRNEEDFGFSMDSSKPPSPGAQLAAILRDGPPHGIHALIWCDSMNTVSRMFDRQALRHFEHRVLFQMSASDSTALIDTPQASKLGFHRALYLCEEDGQMEKFRPYAAPPRDWLAQLRARFDSVKRSNVHTSK